MLALRRTLIVSPSPCLHVSWTSAGAFMQKRGVHTYLLNKISCQGTVCSSPITTSTTRFYLKALHPNCSMNVILLCMFSSVQHTIQQFASFWSKSRETGCTFAGKMTQLYSNRDGHTKGHLFPMLPAQGRLIARPASQVVVQDRL